jgi:hypothetical protein
LFFASLQSCSVAIGTGVALIALSDAVELANTTKSTQFIVPSHQGFAGRARILTTPGVELVGPLPPEIQYYTAFVGGISAQSKAPDAALGLIKFPTGPIAIPVIKSQGMERLRWPLPVIFDRAKPMRKNAAAAQWRAGSHAAVRSPGRARLRRIAVSPLESPPLDTLSAANRPPSPARGAPDRPAGW